MRKGQFLDEEKKQVGRDSNSGQWSEVEKGSLAGSLARLWDGCQRLDWTDP